MNNHPSRPATFWRRLPLKGKYALPTIVVAVLVGIVVVVAIFAATAGPRGSVEAENGIPNNGALRLALGGASGGKGVKFGPAPTGSSTPSPVVPPASGTPPASGGNDPGSAAAAFNWGTPSVVENFDNLDKWGLYTAAADYGHKVPGNVSVSGGIMTIMGKSDGTNGGLAWNGGEQKYGRWEVKMKASGQSGCWRPIALLWSNKNDTDGFPSGGEIDYAESFGDFGKVNFFFHDTHGSQTFAETSIDATQWNYYAVEWTSSAVRGYVNGKQFFEDTNQSHQPPVGMHETFQLDSKDYSGTCHIDTQQHVDYMKIYPVN